jgi:hypothetical protein
MFRVRARTMASLGLRLGVELLLGLDLGSALG